MMILLHTFRFLLPKNIAALAFWPFILFRDEKYLQSKRIINHERIHLRQRIELLVLPFYFIYFAEYLLKLIVYRNHQQAYENISFEREAYANDDNLDYLKNRKFWGMWRE